MNPELPTQTVLSPGTQVGPYRIEAPLGVGGMGEVFATSSDLGTPIQTTYSMYITVEQFVK